MSLGSATETFMCRFYFKEHSNTFKQFDYFRRSIVLGIWSVIDNSAQSVSFNKIECELSCYTFHFTSMVTGNISVTIGSG